MNSPVRIAMWSGPRNLSTALMRSFSSRPDCAVVDEPFYAHYLRDTGIDHPMRAVILDGAAGPDAVAASLAGPVPEGKTVYYQKHMCHHMRETTPRDWMAATVPVFLIRDPARVIASYTKKREAVDLDDLGVPQQRTMFEAADDPVVVDAADILADPEAMLKALCAAVGIAFMPQMLAWPAGPHPADGVWGQHWYGRIWASTGFEPVTQEAPVAAVPEALYAAQELYDEMRAVRLGRG